ncbi:hypothetical protein HZA39_01430 [Candidatus Peregrinibacteria bacterium]|nr:hypothetical protein [Candidatus Peregrinibacteria bacterium]
MNTANNIGNQELEKHKKIIKNTGTLAIGIGWLTIFLNIAIYLWSLFDKSLAETSVPLPDLTSVSIAIVFSATFIIFGNRIKNLTDPNIKKYLYLLMGLSLAVLALSFASSGRLGVFFLVVLFYVVSSLKSINKLMGIAGFTSALKPAEYKIKKTGWIMLAVAAVLLLAAAALIDSSIYASSGERTKEETAEYLMDGSQWKEFNSAAGKFKVLFPAYPDHETQNLEIPGAKLPLKYDLYSSRSKEGILYIVNAAVYPPEVNTSKPEINLENTLKGMVSAAKGNKLTSSNFMNFGNYKALEFLIDNSDENTSLKGKIIMVDKTIYQLLMGYEIGKYNKSDYEPFINSFQLIE